MGTALTSEQVKLLSRAAKRIVVVFDGDAAGARAAEKAIPVAVEAGLFFAEPTLMAAWRRCRPVLIQTTSCGAGRAGLPRSRGRGAAMLDHLIQQAADDATIPARPTRPGGWLRSWPK